MTSGRRQHQGISHFATRTTQRKVRKMENRVALVTGAAGGIGAAVARALSECGAAVAAVDRDTARLRETVDKPPSRSTRPVSSTCPGPWSIV